MRSALLAVLTRLLFPLEYEDLGVQHEHFRQRLFELPAEVHALAHRIDPQLGNRLDPLFAMDHEGERPKGVTLAVGTVAGRLAATAVSELKEFFMVTGQYDMVLIAEAPDDTAIAKAVLSLASKGAIQSETLRAFTESEYRSILSGL